MKLYNVPGKVCGIYMLIKDEVVIYVGQSVDVHSRAMAHRFEKDFDCYTVIHCPEVLLDDLETLLVLALNPESNGKLPSSKLWASLDTLANVFNMQKYKIKELVEKHAPTCVRGYYRIHEIAELLQHEHGG